MAQKIYKVTLLGEGAVGKTSLKRTYMGEEFVDGYKMTIGTDFAVKKFQMDYTDIVLQIWDLAGQPRFDAVREIYYQGTRGAIIAFDISRTATYEILPKWVYELVRNNNNRIIPMVLVGNKADLRDTVVKSVPKDYGKDYAKQLSEWSGFKVPYFETSAKTGQNVDKSFELLTKQLIQHEEKLRVELELH